MPQKEILILGNPCLWKTSEKVTDLHSISPVISDLSDTLAAFRSANGFGRAIAAPQIGILKRVIFTSLLGGLPLINPVISEASQDLFELWDDCFSLPDIMVRVKRHQSISVTYQDLTGKIHILRAEGDLSELLQHEIDHLDGILATDRAIDSHSFAMRSEVMRHLSNPTNQANHH